MRAPVHAAPPPPFFLHSSPLFLSSSSSTFCQFPATTSPCPPTLPSSLRIHSFFLPDAFFFASSFLFFSLTTRATSWRERNIRVDVGLDTSDGSTFGEFSRWKNGEKIWGLINLHLRFLRYSTFQLFVVVNSLRIIYRVPLFLFHVIVHRPD